MIGKLIDELEHLEKLRERDENDPIVFVNVPDGNGNVLTISLRLAFTQGKCKSPCHAMLLLIKAFRDGTIKSVAGKHRPGGEANNLTHSGTHDLEKRIANIESQKEAA